MVDGVDTERGAVVAGSRGYFLKVCNLANMPAPAALTLSCSWAPLTNFNDGGDPTELHILYPKRSAQLQNLSTHKNHYCTFLAYP